MSIPLRPFGRHARACRRSASAAITSARCRRSARPCRSCTPRSTPASRSWTTPGNTTSGESEIRMGKAIADRRERVFLMTKVCTHGRDASVAMRQLEQSLKRLQPTTSISGRSTSASTTTIRSVHFARGGVIEALDRAQARGQGPLRRLHRPQGSRDPPADAVASAIRSTVCQLPLNCFDASFRSFEQRVLPELHRQRIAPLGMKSLGGDRRGREEEGGPRRGRAALRDEPAGGDDDQRHRLDARAAAEPPDRVGLQAVVHAPRWSGSATASRRSPPTAASSCTRRPRSTKGTWAAQQHGFPSPDALGGLTRPVPTRSGARVAGSRSGE